MSEYMASRMDDQIECSIHSQREAFTRIAQLESELLEARRDSALLSWWSINPISVYQIGSTDESRDGKWGWKQPGSIKDRVFDSPVEALRAAMEANNAD